MRRLSLTLFILVLMGLYSVAVAQDVNCGDLSDADCTLLTESSRVMGEIESGILHIDITMTLDSGVGDNVLSTQIRADGGFTIDRESYNDLLTGTLSDDAIINNIVAFITGSSLDMSILVTVPDAITTAPITSTIDFLMVDGVLYLNADKVQEADGLSPTGWFGIDFTTGIEQVLAEDVGALSTVILALRTMPPPDFSLWMRVEDITIDGQTMAVFEQVFVFADVLDDPLTRRALETQFLLILQQQGLGAGLSQSDLQTAVSNYVELFNGLTITLRQVVGTEDYYVYSATMIIDWQPSTEALLDVLSGPDPIGLGQLISTLYADYTIDIRRHNQVTPISAPPDAIIVPLETILGAGF